MVVAVEARGHPLPMDSTSHPANLTHPPSRVVVSLISRCILHMLSAILLSTDLTPNLRTLCLVRASLGQKAT